MKKKLITTLAAGAIALVMCSGAFAVDNMKAVTITGDAACSKCVLKEANAQGHQIAITVSEGENPGVYYLSPNEATQKLGKDLCAAHKKVTATGTVNMSGDKKELTATKAEIVK